MGTGTFKPEKSLVLFFRIKSPGPHIIVPPITTLHASSTNFVFFQ